MDDNREFFTPIYPDLKGKRVIVTGGSAGIGKATALAFSKNGAIVTIMARTIKKLQDTIKEFPNKGYYISVDLTTLEDVKKAVTEALEKMGGVDILINNGAVSNSGLIQKPTDTETLQHMLNLHVVSCMQLIDECKEELIKNKGVVVNVSSMSSTVIIGERIPYCIAKGAQDTMMRCMALYLSQQGVRVNSVNPGRVDTEALQNCAHEMGISKQQLIESSMDAAPLGNYTHAWEQANAILFLSSSSSAGSITGNSIYTDGGIHLTRWINQSLKADEKNMLTQ